MATKKLTTDQALRAGKYVQRVANKPGGKAKMQDSAYRKQQFAIAANKARGGDLTQSGVPHGESGASSPSKSSKARNPGPKKKPNLGTGARFSAAVRSARGKGVKGQKA